MNHQTLAPTKLPSRFTEHSFRRYEAMIHEMVTKYPERIKVDPSPLSPCTYACRFRDAIQSFLTYHWASPLNEKSVSETKAKIEVVEGKGVVWIQPRGYKEVEPMGHVITEHRGSEPVTIQEPHDLEVVTSVCYLKHKGVLTAPYLFVKLPEHMTFALQKLETTLDIGVHYDNETDTHTII